MPEALEAVRRQFGDDAVILATRRIGTGRTAFEVVAAKDAPDGAEPSAQAAPPPWSRASGASVLVAEPAAGSHATAATHAAGGTQGGATSHGVPGTGRATLFDELRGLQGKLQTLTELLMANTPQDLSDEGRRVHLGLVEAGLDARLATAIVRRASRQEGPLEDAVRQEIVSNLAIGEPIRSGAGRQVIAFVGPTGVGKTTTIAKLAARLLLRERLRVRLASVDRLRVGGTYQLGFYAEVLGAPFSAVTDAGALARTIRTAADADVVLIDTTGCGGADREGAEEIGRILADTPDIKVWLVLSAVAKRMDNLASLRVFSRLDPSGLVLSKLDETPAHGGAITVAIRSGLPIHYLTNGQDVPEDISEATSSAIADLLLAGRPA